MEEWRSAGVPDDGRLLQEEVNRGVLNHGRVGIRLDKEGARDTREVLKDDAVTDPERHAACRETEGGIARERDVREVVRTGWHGCGRLRTYSYYFMKTILTFFFSLILLASNSAFSGDRVVLVERFTSSTCPPCASNNPIMDAWLHSQDSDRVLGIAYHMNWPSPGNDPMYWYNVSDNNGKRTYYNVNSIPQAFMDGIINIQPAYTTSGLTSLFNSRTGIPTPITVVVTDSTFGDSVIVRARIYCEVSMASPTVYVNFLVLEKHITNINPPATNGETDFYDVMRRTLPGPNGMQLYLFPGQTYTVEQRYAIDQAWQQSQIKDIVFVQASNQEILAAAQKTNDFTLIPNSPFASVIQGQSQSADFQFQAPVVASGYNSAVTLTAAVDPPNAGISVSFPSGNVISSFPGSVNVHVASSGAVTSGAYRIIVTGTNTNNRTHISSVSYLVGKNYVYVNSNRPDRFLQFKIDNQTFTLAQFNTWDLGVTHTLSAVTPQTITSTRYIFRNWSDGGDTSHVATISPQISSYIVNYGVQFKLITSMQPSAIPATITGGNVYYDSASTAPLSISPVQLQYNNQTWYFQRWQGTGPGSYTGPLAGVQIPMNGVIVESAIWDTVAPIGIINLSNGIPKQYALHQNYPNPFNPTTKVKFDIPRTGLVKLTLYDVLGNEVAVILDGVQNAGYYEAEINASSYASGIYFYVLRAGNYTETRKMILLK